MHRDLPLVKKSSPEYHKNKPAMSDYINSNESSFELFFQAWLVRQQYYLDQLLFLTSMQNHPQREQELKTLVRQVLSHYQGYYEAKSRVAHGNVFLLFSPPWFSTFESSFLWIAGFKPGLAFTILEKSVGGELTAQQDDRIQRLKVETRVIEKTLSDEMAKIQESIAGPTWMQLATRRDGQVANGEVDHVVDTARCRLRDLVVNADFLRASTARDLVEILSTVQAAKFLAATARLQLKVRTLGLQRDAQRMRS